MSDEDLAAAFVAALKNCDGLQEILAEFRRRLWDRAHEDAEHGNGTLRFPTPY